MAGPGGSRDDYPGGWASVPLPAPTPRPVDAPTLREFLDLAEDTGGVVDGTYATDAGETQEGPAPPSGSPPGDEEPPF